MMELGYIIDGMGRQAKNVSIMFGDEATVRANHQELIRNTPVESFVTMNPLHGDELLFVDESTLDAWGNDLTGPKCDGLMTRLSYVGLECRPADCCVYILFHKSKEPLLSVIHSGRAGSVLRILDKAVTQGAYMQSLSVEEYAKDLQVIQAPAICPEHYRMRFLDVPVDDFDFWRPCISGNYNIDLAESGIRLSASSSIGTMGINISEFNRNALLGLGVLAENISISDICTYESKNHFSHFRAEKDRTLNGRFMVLGYMHNGAVQSSASEK